MKRSWYGMAWWMDRRRVADWGRARRLTRASAFVIVFAIGVVVPASAFATEFETWEGFSASNPMPAGRTPGSESSPFNLPVPVWPEKPKEVANGKEIVKFVVNTARAKEEEKEPIEQNKLPGWLDTTGEWEHPTYYAKMSDPVDVLELNSGPEVYCESSLCKALVGRKIHVPAAAEPAPPSYLTEPYTDGHMQIVLAPEEAKTVGETVDLWRARPVEEKEGKRTLRFSAGSTGNITGSLLGGEADAAHFDLEAGMIRAPELEAGVIPHALFCVIKKNKEGKHVYPAGANDGTSKATYSPEEGQRFWLEMSPKEIANLKHGTGPAPVWEKAIATAMADYGCYDGDSTGGPAIGFEFESSVMYTAFGLPNPFREYGKAHKGEGDIDEWPENGKEETLVFKFDQDIPWATKLRAITSPAPWAITEAASGVKSTEATLNATINPEDLETKYYFEYGTSESYGKKTAEASAGSGMSNVKESKTVTGLKASTTYHFRIVAKNSAGTTHGKDHILTTPS